VRNEHAGFLFAAWNVNAYVDAIAELDKDRARLARMSHNAKTLARQLFDPTRYGQRLAEIYTNVLASGD
jgi:glycosyltransferase involved in cell wall biosynthesis